MSDVFGVVYGLYDPRDGALRYIGQTTRPVKERLKYHLSKVNLSSKSHCARWLSQLVSTGLHPVTRVLDQATSRENLDTLEINLISKARASGERLTNLASGGKSSSGYKLGNEFRREVSRRMSGRKVSPETKSKLSHLNKGKVVSLGTRIKLSSSLRGRTLTEVTRAKLSALSKSRTGSKHSRFRHEISAEDILKLLSLGYSKAKVASTLGVSIGLVYRRVSQGVSPDRLDSVADV